MGGNGSGRRTDRVIHVVQINRHGIALGEDVTVGLGLKSGCHRSQRHLGEHVAGVFGGGTGTRVCTSADMITRIPMKVGTATGPKALASEP